MRQLYVLIILCLNTPSSHGQFGPRQLIANDADGVQSLVVADLDGDGFKDVVCANKFGSSITWYQHLDGEGTFGSQILIDPLQEPLNVFVADLNGDEDLDLLATAPAPGWDQVVWYENLDGQGDFSNRIIIYDGTSPGAGAVDVIAADLDGDGDMDVAMANDLNGVSWFENLDGLGDFSGRKPISVNISVTRTIFAADLDGDDDLDLVANSSGSLGLFWFENLDGQGDFSSQILVAETTAFVNQVFCADLDGDTDMDIVTAIPGLDVVAWHENVDGQGNFGPEQIISTAVDFPRTVFVADLDNDNDNDVISGSSSDGKIAWYENLDGAANFGPQQLLTTEAPGARKVYAEDLDDDGDLEVFSASQNDDMLSWYENLTILGVEDYGVAQVTLVPNPVKNVLSLQTQEQIQKVTVYDVLGRKLFLSKGNTTSINVSQFPIGLLFVEIITNKGMGVEKVIKE